MLIFNIKKFYLIISTFLIACIINILAFRPLLINLSAKIGLSLVCQLIVLGGILNFIFLFFILAYKNSCIKKKMKLLVEYANNNNEQTLFEVHSNLFLTLIGIIISFYIVSHLFVLICNVDKIFQNSFYLISAVFILTLLCMCVEKSTKILFFTNHRILYIDKGENVSSINYSDIEYIKKSFGLLQVKYLTNKYLYYSNYVILLGKKGSK